MRAAHRELEKLKRELSGPPSDFTGAFLKTQNLRRLIHQSPAVVDEGTVRLLGKILTHPPYQAQKQAYFFSRETALGLRDLLETSPHPNVVHQARRLLERLCLEPHGACQRAACEALGALPVPMGSPPPSFHVDPWCVPVLSWQHVLSSSQISEPEGYWKRCGRSFWKPSSKTGRLVVFKTAKDPESAEALFREIQWMRFLNENPLLCPEDTAQLPAPLTPNGPWLCRVESFPKACSPLDHGHRDKLWAIVFTAPLNYFDYPNQPKEGRMLPKAAFLAAMVRSARELARLATQGILHTAPIPLFHNRVQAHRREDAGLYRWPRAGRLDRWLASCDYPNFGASGVRDLEHLEPAGANGVPIYEQIGAHLLSLFLVCGSYFRNRDRRLRGLQADGTPVDVRNWFDKAFFIKLMESIFRAYYEAFAGQEAPMTIPGQVERLVERMIEEMGVDRHMEEILRVADQNSMTDEEFWTFLEERGYSRIEARRLVRGKDDVVLLTGPHLGAFNDRISLPELIQFVGAAAALCISGRYFCERQGPRNLASRPS
ncbi:SidJ-related pseudokinase [Desulfosoma caldarium]|uniref:Uncharacterized protein n=1 Tax=Desulfosoma caldarium TaxID=610254 RepID=A0A3N1UM53_9BACT|nr:SidJ-related pseudokinase [Desulfosoma caldarium]ROQ90818.1 hypothetical protein EDC27_2712 [Desulfosoma caldarium]